MTPDFSVDVEPVGLHAFRIVWTFDGKSCPPYLIDADVRMIAKGHIRPALRRLLELGALARWSTSGAVAILKDLQRSGYLLHRALFRRIGGDATQSEVDAIRDIVASRTAHCSVCFRVRARVHIPWALVADADPSGPDDDLRPEAFQAFWALKYSISTVYDQLPTINLPDIVHSADEFETLLAAHGRVQQKVTSAAAQLPEAALFELLHQKYGAPVQSTRSLLETWTAREARLGLLYFYCHANRTEIAFSRSDTLDVVQFKYGYNKSAATPRCLVFLNGCHTAAGSAHGGFLEATGRMGFCGFVGAETVLPYLFAHRFGAAFIAGLYSGETLGAIMDRLRRQHWPLSLAYGLYAYPSLRLYPTCAMPRMSVENYSEMPVGHTLV